MSQQIQITGGAKVRDLQDVIIGTSGVLSSLAFDVANGVPKLDSNGKILVSQLPNSVMEYKGTWNASTNTPTLANGTGNQGDVYLCNVAGTVNFGAGPIAFVVGDQVIYSGSIWQRASGATGTVTSVAVTESGDSLNITGSPITTSGTINIGFNGTNLQYVNGAGNLTTFPILTGYVPYTGATQDVDLGAFKLNAQSLHIKGTAGNGHLGLKHQSASATASANEVSLFADTLGDLSWLNGNLYLSKFITSGNTAARSYTFPNATCNIPDDSLVVHLAGTETITGAKTFSGYTTFTSTVDITSGLTFSNSGFTLVLQPPTLSVNRTVTLPNGTGTLALTSDIPSLVGYVPYTGATTNVDLGNFSATGNTSNFRNSYINGTASVQGQLMIKQAVLGSTNYAGYSSIYSTGSNITVISDVAGTTYKSAILSFGSLTNNTDRTYTFPDASGTIALVGGSGVGTVTSVAALTIGTSGTDLSSSVANSTTTPVITLNVPTASASNRGALSSADWSTFNSKQGTITLTTTGTSGAATFSSNTLNIPQYQGVLTNPVTGTGTTNYLPKFTGASTIGNSIVQDDATTVTVGGQLYVNRNDSNVIKVARNGGSDLNTVIEFANATTSVHIGSNGTLFGLGGTTGSIAAQPFIIVPSSSEKMRLDASGNLGLGVTPSAFTSSTTTKSFEIGSLGNAIYGVGAADLRIMSNTYFDGSYRYAFSGALSSLYTISDGNFKWYNAPSGTAGNAITFTQAMTLTAAGSLGLGTPTPSAITGALVLNMYAGAGIRSSLVVESNAGANFAVLGSGLSGADLGVFYYNLGMRFGSATSKDATGFSESMRITSGGNVLIGTTTDSGYKLDVNGTGRFSGALTGTSATFSGNIVTTGASAEIMANGAGSSNTVGGSSRFTILDSSNSRGWILQQDASYKLNFWHYNGGWASVANISGTGAATFSSSVTASNFYAPSSTGFWSDSYDVRRNGFVADGTNLVFRAGNSSTGEQTRMVIAQATGNVGIGTSTPSALLHIQKTSAGAATIAALLTNNDGTAGTETRLAFTTLNADPASNRYGYIAYQINGVNGGDMIFATNVAGGGPVEAMRIKNVGDIICAYSVTATSFFESSDSRLKTLIQDNYQTKGITSITPKLYTKNGKVELGYYAQDFVGVLDSAVSKGSDDMLSLSYREVLVAKVYALEQEIKELKAKMN